MLRPIRPSIEHLENRTLFNAMNLAETAYAPGSSSAVVVATATTPFAAGFRVTATAGTPLSRVVGFFAVTPSSLVSYSATIDWGDRTTPSAAALAKGTDGKYVGLNVRGTHTYSKSGTFTVTVSLYARRITLKPTQPVFVEHVTTTAVVSPLPPNSIGGHNLNLLAGKQYVDLYLGNFEDIGGRGPTHYSANVSWGDGTNSTAKISSIDDDILELDGTHTYALAGKYAVHITIMLLPATPGGPTTVYGTVQSTAVVTGVVLQTKA